MSKTNKGLNLIKAIGLVALVCTIIGFGLSSCEEKESEDDWEKYVPES